MIGIIAFALITCIPIIIYYNKKKKRLDYINDLRYENIITDIERKKQLATSAIYLLVNENKMKLEEIEGTKAEFAYLLASYNKVVALFKIITVNGETYYFSTNDNNELFAIESSKINDELFYETQTEMFKLHKITNYDKKDYTMIIEKEQ